MNPYSIYSAAEGPKPPNFYIKSKPPQFTIKPQPPELNYMVSYVPVQTMTLTQLIPTKTTITIPQSDPEPIFYSTNPLPTTTTYTTYTPPTYSTLQNITPRLDEVDPKKINKDFDFNTHYELEFKKEMTIFPYLGIRKKNIPLFGHLELPQEYNYTSPALSSDMNYLACMARGSDDIVLNINTQL